MNEVPISDRPLQHGNFTPGAEPIGKHGRRRGIANGRFEHGRIVADESSQVNRQVCIGHRKFWTVGSDYSIVRPQLSTYNLNRR